MSSSSPNVPQNGTPAKQPSLDADIALLQKLLSEDVDESNPEDVAALLKRLEAAEGLADGVEDRLDGIMEHLDMLLTDLEAKQVAGTGAAGQVEVEVEVETEEIVVSGVTGSEGKAEPDPQAGRNVAAK
ncbi:hypothetical protein GSI_05776 [Ganoderma sinense ZZ0214-1]|uniref:Uncharacterized protein n=1 Tax=Ganoderma sinense ZZ0214-1 TaxID=1077348 RepID=A0A2G8SBE6_9APHY|nr:hypothetical protein GSI_05776 [Ganoderma sinense ZZ0214-1]